MLLGASTLRAFLFLFILPAFVPRTTKCVNNLGKMFLLSFLLSRVCSYIWCFGKQMWGGVLGFVVRFSGSGNKRGLMFLCFDFNSLFCTSANKRISFMT